MGAREETVAVIRRAESDADLEAWRGIWNAITPREPAPPIEVIRRRIEREPERLYLIAEANGQVVGAGFAGPSQSPERTAVAVRVLPAHRGHGLGSALLERVVGAAAGKGRPWASGMVYEDDPDSVAWVAKRGFEEYDRQVVLSRDIGPSEPEPVPPRGIELVTLDESRYEDAYAVWVEGFPDMPLSVPIPPPSYDEWLAEEVSGPVSYLALDDGKVVGAAALLESAEGIGEHGLTATVRSHRGRGIATALKQALIHWASAQGYRELMTGTQEGNAAMRAVNVKLGYRPLPALISVRRRL